MRIRRTRNVSGAGRRGASARWACTLVVAAALFAARPCRLLAQANGAAPPTAQLSDTAIALAHVRAFDDEDRFPSANLCANCHPDQYREWSVSQHAYAQMSPVFNAMHGKILKLTNGTNGDFCIRCHTPVGMNLREPEFMTNMDRYPTSREGVTCIVCHRLDRPNGKASGRLAIVEGDIFTPVYGPTGGAEVKRVIGDPQYSVNAKRGQAGRAIHADAGVLPQIRTSGFCGACHDVNLVNGFRLEEAFSEYKASPASGEKISCQDCHMGKEPGKVSGYDSAAAAIVGGRPTRIRRRTNHMFVGPDYPVIHPGIFPHNVRAAELATIREWLSFDAAAGWGTDAFEQHVPQGTTFPDRWRTADDRIDAREVIQANQTLLAKAAQQRLVLLRNGYILGDVKVGRAGAEWRGVQGGSEERHQRPQRAHRFRCGTPRLPAGGRAGCRWQGGLPVG